MTRVIFGRTRAEVDRKLEGEFRDHLPAAVLAGTKGEIVERLGYLRVRRAASNAAVAGSRRHRCPGGHGALRPAATQRVAGRRR